MSKDNNNLRLLGSPVNLSYRGKKKDDKKGARNRPRSALQNSCFTPEIPERYKRPFSADAKELRNQNSTRNFLNAFNVELIRSYSLPPTNLKILPPTTDILGGRKSPAYYSKRSDKELCSNASDYGSEDTYISLGTKIKAKAQSGSKPKNTNKQNFLKNRNIHKKNRRQMESNNEDRLNNDLGFSVKIVEKPQYFRASSPVKNRDVFKERCLSPSTRSQSYESYFVSLDGEAKRDENPLAGRVSFGTSSDTKIDDLKSSDAYSRRSALTKQQLSLVEEESTQDLESVASQRMPSLPAEDPLDNTKIINDDNGDLTDRNTYIADTKEDDYRKRFINETRTYTSFYEDFRSNPEPYDGKLSSTIVLTDSSSKDSGYPDSSNEKHYHRDYSLPSTSVMKKSNSHNNLMDQPKSLDSVSTSDNDKNNVKSYPSDNKEEWKEPLNHSRLLYKDFFLKKEGHIALPPQNSPQHSSQDMIHETDKNDDQNDSDYPPYLLNSSTKAYTSKVIEDYKKEIEAINNLHELTIKDIKTETVISPTPLDIDKIFEIKHDMFSDKRVVNDSSEESISLETAAKNKNMNKVDVSKVSTKELIQNYLKVKEGNPKSKSLKKYDVKKICNLVAKYEAGPSSSKPELNNKSVRPSSTKSSVSVSVRNPTQKTMFTMKAPNSARIDTVQTDKDIESWMSISAPSPRILEIDQDLKTDSAHKSNSSSQHSSAQDATNEYKATNSKQTSSSTPNVQFNRVPESSVSCDARKPKELDSKSTVLDIYSMLKEIESFTDHPVTSVSNAVIPEASTSQDTPQEETEHSETPKDNFMEIFEFLEKVEQSANDAMSVVTTATPHATPKLESLLRLPHTEVCQRLVTAALQLEERSCCLALLQDALATNKEQMIQKVNNLEKQSQRNIAKVKQECEETIKRHQNFIDQLINDKKTLNHRIEQLVDERRSVEEKWRRAASNLEQRYQLEMRSQHDKMQAAQQVARQRWVRQKAEKIKELTVKGLEGELRDMAERQQKEIADLKMSHAEIIGKMQAKHANELETLRREMEDQKEQALIKERQLASSRLEKQILELEATYQEQRSRLVSEMRADSERRHAELAQREILNKKDLEMWKEDQEKLLEQKKLQMEQEIAAERDNIDELLKQKQSDLEQKFEQYKKEFEAEQQVLFKKKVTEISAQHKRERDEAIERAIESMEQEAQNGRKELQEAMRRNKEQYECELQELSSTERATLRRCQDAQARARGAEDRCAELEISVSQLETRNKVLTEKNIQLESQLSEISSQCEESWRQRTENLKREMQDMRNIHEEQMHQLYAKVKVAVARKDSAIQALTREAAKQQEKITLLEQRLQQQRKDFLKHK